jgi:hypothetical protein
MMQQDQIKVIHGKEGENRTETNFQDVQGIVFWNNKLGAMQQMTVDQIREKYEAPVMHYDAARDAYPLTIEVMAKCIGEQKRMIEALQKDTVALQRDADTRVKEACARRNEDSRVLNNEIRKLKEYIRTTEVMGRLITPKPIYCLSPHNETCYNNCARIDCNYWRRI